MIRQDDDDRLPDESLAMFLQMQQGKSEQERLPARVQGAGHVDASQDEMIEVEEEEEEAPEHDVRLELLAMVLLKLHGLV